MQREGSMNEDLLQDLKTVGKIKFKISCCKSYLTPKGRCYTCPEDDSEA